MPQTASLLAAAPPDTRATPVTADEPAVEPAPRRQPLAVVTGASSGIGLELARCCASHGFDLVLAADRDLGDAEAAVRKYGTNVQCVQVDLSLRAGVDAVLERIGGRPVDALLANAGHGLGHAFLDQEFEAVQAVIDTNVTGTLYLLHAVGRRMRSARRGRILVTGSIAGYLPGAFQAVYNGTKAFIDSFSWALRNELKDEGVTVTCLLPGATDTGFFARADLLDTQLGTGAKDDPADVARIGFHAMLAGEGDVIAGLKNKLQVAAARVTPPAVLAEQHRRMAEPGSARTPQNDG